MTSPLKNNIFNQILISRIHQPIVNSLKNCCYTYLVPRLVGRDEEGDVLDGGQHLPGVKTVPQLKVAQHFVGPPQLGLLFDDLPEGLVRHSQNPVHVMNNAVEGCLKE